MIAECSEQIFTSLSWGRLHGKDLLTVKMKDFCASLEKTQGLEHLLSLYLRITLELCGFGVMYCSDSINCISWKTFTPHSRKSFLGCFKHETLQKFARFTYFFISQSSQISTLFLSLHATMKTPMLAWFFQHVRQPVTFLLFVSMLRPCFAHCVQVCIP